LTGRAGGGWYVPAEPAGATEPAEPLAGLAESAEPAEPLAGLAELPAASAGDAGRVRAATMIPARKTGKALRTVPDRVSRVALINGVSFRLFLERARSSTNARGRPTRRVKLAGCRPSELWSGRPDCRPYAGGSM
jgi:hypothetical protein